MKLRQLLITLIDEAGEDRGHASEREVYIGYRDKLGAYRVYELSGVEEGPGGNVVVEIGEQVAGPEVDG